MSKNNLFFFLLLSYTLFMDGCYPSVQLRESVNPVVVPTTLPDTIPSVPPAVAITPVGQSGNWKLIFNDEFDESSLDKSKWSTCYWWDWEQHGCTIGSNNEMEWYQPDDVLIEKGILRLRAQRRSVISSDGITYPFTSGMISSGRRTKDETAHAAFKYGYFEIRAKLPAGKGLWPAIWLLPDNNESKPEIDILEVLGHEPNHLHMSLHNLAQDGDVERISNTWVGPDFSSDWHTFAFDWQPETIAWYVDGVELWRYSDSNYVPDTFMYLIINLAVGGDWPGAPDISTKFPSYFDIDYVRVWERP